MAASALKRKSTVTICEESLSTVEEKVCVEDENYTRLSSIATDPEEGTKSSASPTWTDRASANSKGSRQNRRKRYSEKHGTSGVNSGTTIATSVAKQSTVDEELRRFMISKGLVSSATTILSDVHSFTESWWTQVVISFVICAENFLIGIDIDSHTNSNARSGRSMVWDVSEISFLAFWTVFNTLHFRAAGLSYFRSRWNLLEVFLITLGFLDLFFARVLDEDSAKFGDYSALRFLRILKLTRLARLGHVVGNFEELRLITNGFVRSFRTLGWVSILLFIAVYSAALYVTIIVGHTCSTHYNDWPQCDKFFARVPSSMFTLFQIMTLDDWTMEIARPVLKEKVWLLMFFLPFMMLTTFGLLNIIVGVIVENTLNQASEQRRVEQEKAKDVLRKDTEKLRRLFMEADQDGNGNVDRDEFRVICKNDEIKTLMKDLGLPSVAPDRLFEVIDVEIRGTISIGEFIEGCLRLKEMPSALDMHTMLMQIQYMMMKVSRVEKMMRTVSGEVYSGSGDSPQAASQSDASPKMHHKETVNRVSLFSSESTNVAQAPHALRQCNTDSQDTIASHNTFGPRRQQWTIPTETLGSPRSEDNSLTAIREDVLTLAARFVEMDRARSPRPGCWTPPALDTSRGKGRSPELLTPKQPRELLVSDSQLEALELKIVQSVQRSVAQALASHQRFLPPCRPDTSSNGTTLQHLEKDSRDPVLEARTPR